MCCQSPAEAESLPTCTGFLQHLVELVTLREVSPKVRGMAHVSSPDPFWTKSPVHFHHTKSKWQLQVGWTCLHVLGFFSDSLVSSLTYSWEDIFAHQCPSEICSGPGTAIKAELCSLKRWVIQRRLGWRSQKRGKEMGR